MDLASEVLIEELNKYKTLKLAFENIINSSYDGIFVTDGHANIIMLNKAYERITGIKSDYIIGKNMAQLVEEGYYSQSGSLEVIRSGKQVTLRQRLISGKEILITSTPVYSKSGRREYIITNVRDISDLVELQNKLSVTQALNEKYRSELENMKEQVIESPEFIVKDKKTINMVRTMLKVAKVDTTVLLTGETGVGKTMAARFIHDNSMRSNNSFIELNCGSIPPNLIESELFGYEGGAFTGALRKGKIGVFELAHNSTLFLDEISEADMNIQVKLLKVLEDGLIRPVGGEKTVKVDVRIIAATNKNLKKMVEKGLFREDLYYRLNVIPIEIPALRKRKDDIIPLCLDFLKEFNKKYEFNKYFTISVLEIFREYDWPGNVRELRNIIEQLVIVIQEDKIDVNHLPSYMFGNNHINDMGFKEDMIIKLQGLGLYESTEIFQKQIIINAIRKYGNRKKAAEHLKVSPSTITRKLRNV